MIKIEVTGGSIPEVADKLLAIGRSLMGIAVVQASTGAEVTVTPVEPAEQAAPKRTRRKATDPVPTAEAAPVGEPATAATEEASTPDTSASAPSDSADTGSSSATDAPAIDFTADVMPAVLRAVEQHGREAVEAVLTEFGVGRASQLPEAQWGEFITRIEDIG